MWTTDGAVSKYHCWLSASTSASTALRIICRSGWYITHIDCIKLGDIHPQFHSGRTVKNWQLPSTESCFTVFTLSRGYLSCVFTSFDTKDLFFYCLVEIHKKLVRLTAALRHTWNTDRVVKSEFSISNFPDHP